jgi:hypothetical protein
MLLINVLLTKGLTAHAWFEPTTVTLAAPKWVRPPFAVRRKTLCQVYTARFAHILGCKDTYNLRLDVTIAASIISSTFAHDVNP